MSITFIEYLVELQSPSEVRVLDQYLDKLFRPLGLNVQFSRHFVERLLGRERKVTGEEVFQSFAKLKQKYKKRLMNAKRRGDYEAVLKDFGNDLNIVFGIQNPERLDAITIMQKDPNNFHVNREGGDELRVK